MKKEPSFAQWIAMSDTERDNIQSQWETYGGEGSSLHKNVTDEFKKQYNDPELQIDPGLDHGGTLVIGVVHPFVYDSRKIPSKFLGFYVKKVVSGELPEEFKITDNQNEYIWAPERYEKFVKRCSETIKKKFGRPDMSEKEMLDALIGHDFYSHKAFVEKSVREGKLPKYKE